MPPLNELKKKNNNNMNRDTKITKLKQKWLKHDLLGINIFQFNVKISVIK
jgi:hypothetical protein